MSSERDTRALRREISRLNEELMQTRSEVYGSFQQDDSPDITQEIAHLDQRLADLHQSEQHNTSLSNQNQSTGQPRPDRHESYTSDPGSTMLQPLSMNTRYSASDMSTPTNRALQQNINHQIQQNPDTAEYTNIRSHPSTPQMYKRQYSDESHLSIPRHSIETPSSSVAALSDRVSHRKVAILSDRQSSSERYNPTLSQQNTLSQ